MSETNEWLFDIIMELSDKSHDAGLPAVAAKLEEALDTYLAESDPAAAKIAMLGNGGEPLLITQQSDAAEQAKPMRQCQRLQKKREQVRGGGMPLAHRAVPPFVSTRA